jgi:bacteriocin biosynthesis cyclodehydratase domain-containing protein
MIALVMTPSQYLKPALPFTVLTGTDTVRLVAGEDCRYTLTAPGLECWLPELLIGLDGRHSVAELLDTLDPDRRAAADQLLERLYGERVLVDAAPRERHVPRQCALVVEGEGPLADGLRARARSGPTGPDRLLVLCQDRLDYAALLDFNGRCRAGRDLGLWVSTGALQRGYVSPVLVPDAVPCLACLIGHFRRLSPAPELYDHLAEHARQGRPIAPAPFPVEGVVILQQLVLWKWSLLEQAEPPAALYRLHVLEVASLEVAGRRVFADPECPVCGEAG